MTQDTHVDGEMTHPFINFHCVHLKDQGSARVLQIIPSVLLHHSSDNFEKCKCWHFTAVSGEQDDKHAKSPIFLSKESILFKSKLKMLFHT